MTSRLKYNITQKNVNGKTHINDTSNAECKCNHIVTVNGTAYHSDMLHPDVAVWEVCKKLKLDLAKAYGDYIVSIQYPGTSQYILSTWISSLHNYKEIDKISDEFIEFIEKYHKCFANRRAKETYVNTKYKE